MYIRLHFPVSLFFAPIRIPAARIRGVVRSSVGYSDAAIVQVQDAEDIQIVVTLADAELIAKALLGGRYADGDAVSAAPAQVYFRRHVKRKAILTLLIGVTVSALALVASYSSLRVLGDEAVAEGLVVEWPPRSDEGHPKGARLVPYTFIAADGRMYDGAIHLHANELAGVGQEPRIAYCAADPRYNIPFAYRWRRLQIPLFLLGLVFLGFAVFNWWCLRITQNPAAP